jgi:ABC-2 type transport system permease protein
MQFRTALKFNIKEQLTNRFAFGLLIVFVPLWYWLLGIITPGTPLSFRFRPTGTFIQANGHDLTLISAGLNLLTMILGFMFYHAAQRSLDFDRRLTRAGLNKLAFLAASTTAILMTTAVVALYMVLVLLLFWHFPHNIFEVWLGFWLVSLTYAGIGRVLGMLLTSELVGFFIIVMFSMTDVFLQNPLGNPAANKPFLEYFPSYSAMQLSVAGGFTRIFASKQVLLALGWFLSFLVLSLIVFSVRTRRRGGAVKLATERPQEHTRGLEGRP